MLFTAIIPIAEQSGAKFNRNLNIRISITCPPLPLNFVRVDPVADGDYRSGGHHFISHFDHFYMGFENLQHGNRMGFVRKCFAVKHAFEVPNHVVEGLFDPFAGEFVFVFRLRKYLLNQEGIGQSVGVEEHIFDSARL